MRYQCLEPSAGLSSLRGGGEEREAEAAPIGGLSRRSEGAAGLGLRLPLSRAGWNTPRLPSVLVSSPVSGADEGVQQLDMQKELEMEPGMQQTVHVACERENSLPPRTAGDTEASQWAVHLRTRGTGRMKRSLAREGSLASGSSEGARGCRWWNQQETRGQGRGSGPSGGWTSTGVAGTTGLALTAFGENDNIATTPEALAAGQPVVGRWEHLAEGPGRGGPAAGRPRVLRAPCIQLGAHRRLTAHTFHGPSDTIREDFFSRPCGGDILACPVSPRETGSATFKMQQQVMSQKSDALVLMKAEDDSLRLCVHSRPVFLLPFPA